MDRPGTRSLTAVPMAMNFDQRAEFVNVRADAHHVVRADRLGFVE